MPVKLSHRLGIQICYQVFVINGSEAAVLLGVILALFFMVTEHIISNVRLDDTVLMDIIGMDKGKYGF